MRQRVLVPKRSSLLQAGVRTGNEAGRLHLIVVQRPECVQGALRRVHSHLGSVHGIVDVGLRQLDNRRGLPGGRVLAVAGILRLPHFDQLQRLINSLVLQGRLHDDAQRFGIALAVASVAVEFSSRPRAVHGLGELGAFKLDLGHRKHCSCLLPSATTTSTLSNVRLRGKWRLGRSPLRLLLDHHRVVIRALGIAIRCRWWRWC
mmetsp:Transcript_63283/g.136037  ORF Transcript_63283/g.136037 Transcript_63283/m.136037 type:complete len:204 (-) Transcript_63283:382-993(-)